MLSILKILLLVFQILKYYVYEAKIGIERFFSKKDICLKKNISSNGQNGNGTKIGVANQLRVIRCFISRFEAGERLLQLLAFCPERKVKRRRWEKVSEAAYSVSVSPKGSPRLGLRPRLEDWSQGLWLRQAQRAIEVSPLAAPPLPPGILARCAFPPTVREIKKVCK